MFFLFTWFVKITGWLPYLVLLRPKTYYENKKVQSRRIRGGAVVVSNHTSIYDFAVTMFTFPTRTLRCAVAELMYEKNIFMTFLLRALGTIKVDRAAHDFAFMSTCAKILDRGGVVEIYPESRLPLPEESRPLEFKPSAIYLALQTGTPIIPICNNGHFFEKRRMRVMIGTPIDVRSLYNDELSERENIANITSHVRGKIIELIQRLEEKEKQEKR